MNYIPVKHNTKLENEYKLAILAFLNFNNIIESLLNSNKYNVTALQNYVNDINTKASNSSVRHFVDSQVNKMKIYQDNQFNYQFDRKVDDTKIVKDATLYNFVFVKQYREELQFIVESAITYGLLTDASQNMINEFVLGKQKALEDRISMFSEDGTIKTIDSLTRYKLIELGYNSYDWQTMEDDRVRHAHEELNHKRLSLHEPHPTEGFPGVPPRCRCLIANPSKEYA